MLMQILQDLKPDRMCEVVPRELIATMYNSTKNVKSTNDIS